MAISAVPQQFAYDQIIMIGDSITQGAFGPGGPGTALVQRYTRKLDVLNRGFGGYNSAWCLELAQKFLPRPSTSPQIRLLTIWLGANDCVSPTSLQHVSEAEFAANIRSLVSLARSLPSKPEIILITCPPFHGASWDLEMARRGVLPQGDERSPARAKSYADLMKRLGTELGLPVVDAWEAIEKVALEEGKQEAEKYINYLPDGLHPNELGYQVVTKELEKVIERDLPALHWDMVSQQFPAWDQVPNGALGSKFQRQTPTNGPSA